MDFLASKLGFRFKRYFFVLLGEKNHNEKRVVFVKPLTYMNRSGEALRLFPVSPSSLLVVHDELDLPVGRIKLKKDGGDGGHKGVRSMVRHLGSRDFYRLKIGIGRPPKGFPLADYVLSLIPEEDVPRVWEAFEKAFRLFELILDYGFERAWSMYRMEESVGGDNSKTNQV